MSTPLHLTETEVRQHMKVLDNICLLKPLHDVCKSYNVRIEDVLSKARTKRVVVARDACCAKLSVLGLSSTEAGKALNMDHVSVIHAIRRYKQRDNGKKQW